MKKIIQSVISIILCVCMLVPFSGYAAAAKVGQVKSLSVKSTTSSTVSLTWKKASGAKQYRVYRYDNSNDKWVQVAKTSSTSVKISDLASAKAYKFRVRAYNGSSKGSYSSSVTAVTTPKKVSSLSASGVTSNVATLKWGKVTRATGYQIYKYDYSSSSWKLLKTTSSTSYKITGLSSGTTHTFRVRAYFKSGKVTKYGSYSSTVRIVTRPDQVKNLKVSDVTKNSYKLSWSKVNKATKYEVYRYESSGWKLFFTTNLTYYNVKNASLASKQFKVRAVTVVDKKSYYGSFSSVVTAKANANTNTGSSSNTVKLSAPDNLTLVSVPGSGKISISWDKVRNANGYEVYKFDTVNNSWVRIRTTDATSIQYSVSQAGTYKFKVRAYAKSNNKNVYSAFSKESDVRYVTDSAEDTDSVISDLESKGVLGYLYDPDNHCFYTAVDSWQRNFGFTPVYDYCAPFTIMFYNTKRIKFEYDDREWMIQIWKGQYGWVFIGAEIGIYNRKSSLPLDFYACVNDEDMMYMSMTVALNDYTIINRPYSKHWWCTGFVPGVLPSAILGAATGNIKTSALTMNARITLKDLNMRKAFCKALEENGFVLGKTYMYSGCDVIFIWK